MGWTVLYIAFGVVALWLLGEVLLQYKARLRWRLVAFFGFLGVVAGVLVSSVPLIAVGTVGFAVGQTFVTLSFRRGFATGWALGGKPGTSRRRREGGGFQEDFPHDGSEFEAPDERGGAYADERGYTEEIQTERQHQPADGYQEPYPTGYGGGYGDHPASAPASFVDSEPPPGVGDHPDAYPPTYTEPYSPAYAAHDDGSGYPQYSGYSEYSTYSAYSDPYTGGTSEYGTGHGTSAHGTDPLSDPLTDPLGAQPGAPPGHQAYPSSYASTTQWSGGQPYYHESISDGAWVPQQRDSGVVDDAYGYQQPGEQYPHQSHDPSGQGYSGQRYSYDEQHHWGRTES